MPPPGALAAFGGITYGIKTLALVGNLALAAFDSLLTGAAFPAAGFATLRLACSEQGDLVLEVHDLSRSSAALGTVGLGTSPAARSLLVTCSQAGARSHTLEAALPAVFLDGVINSPSDVQPSASIDVVGRL